MIEKVKMTWKPIFTIEPLGQLEPKEIVMGDKFCRIRFSGIVKTATLNKLIELFENITEKK